EAGERIRDPEDLQVATDRHAVDRLAAVEAVAGRVQAEDAARGRDGFVVAEPLRYAPGRDDPFQAGELLPVAVRFEEHLPARDGAAEGAAGLARRARRRAAVLRRGLGAAHALADGRVHGLERVQDVDGR